MRDTIDMAREAGFEAMRVHGVLPHVPEAIFIANVCVTEEVNRLVALVRADEREICTNAAMAAAEEAVNFAMALEREACAQLCEDQWQTAHDIQDAIRNRGNT